MHPVHGQFLSWTAPTTVDPGACPVVCTYISFFFVSVYIVFWGVVFLFGFVSFWFALLLVNSCEGLRANNDQRPDM